MMPSNQTEIQAFLKQFAIVAEEGGEVQSKAGLIPFIKGAPTLYYAMKPVAAQPELGLPEFQICKGTRLWQNEAGNWVDMRGKVPQNVPLEPLPETALREGVEELGLILSNIESLIPLGIQHFSSATTHKTKTMWLLAAEMKNPDDFLPGEAIARTTAERAWLDVAGFRKQARPDHAHIISQIEPLLIGK